MNRRKFCTWAKRLGIFLFAFWLTISLWQAPVINRTISATDPIRGVWLTNYGSAFSYYTTRLDELTANLVQHHINTVYPAVWNRGSTLFPSQVVKSVGGPIRSRLTSLPLLPFQNPMGSLVHHAHRQHLRIIPWFEYGLWVPASSAIAQKHPDWLTTTIEGDIIASSVPPSKLPSGLKDVQQEFTGLNQAWLNPAHPEVQTFLTNLILEVAQKYDVDGVQLDDHFGLPVAFGYDDLTQKLYQESHQGLSPPNDPNDREWVAWRADQITQLMTKIVTEVRAAKPDIIISLSPSPPRFAYEKYLQDWTRWADIGLLDEVLVQVYREDPSFLQAELDKQTFHYLRGQMPVAIGLYTGPGRNGKPIEQIKTEVEIVQDAGYDDVSFFCWETTFWILKKSSHAQVKAAFQQLFGAVS